MDSRKEFLIGERNDQRDANFVSDLEKSRYRKKPRWKPYTFALDTARNEGNAERINFPFTGVYIPRATDSNVEINLSLDGGDSRSISEALPLRNKDNYTFDETVAAAFLTWASQPGKTITIFFLTEGRFGSGSILSVSAGGVSVTEGSSCVGAALGRR